MKIVAIPDLHFPFVDKVKLAEAVRITNKFNPEAVIQLGDLYDQISFSKYARDVSEINLTPAKEAELGRGMAEVFWNSLKKRNRTLLQITDANHDVRIVKRMNERAPEASFIAKEWLRHQLTFDGVKCVESEYCLDGIMFMHGHKKAGTHAPYNQMNTVTGHTHTAGIKYFSNIFGNYWEANSGWLGDKSSPVFSYREQSKIDGTQHGLLLIEDGNPQFWSL